MFATLLTASHSSVVKVPNACKYDACRFCIVRPFQGRLLSLTCFSRRVKRQFPRPVSTLANHLRKKLTWGRRVTVEALSCVPSLQTRVASLRHTGFEKYYRGWGRYLCVLAPCAFFFCIGSHFAATKMSIPERLVRVKGFCDEFRHLSPSHDNCAGRAMRSAPQRHAPPRLLSTSPVLPRLRMRYTLALYACAIRMRQTRCGAAPVRLPVALMRL